MERLCVLLMVLVATVASAEPFQKNLFTSKNVEELRLKEFIGKSCRTFPSAPLFSDFRQGSVGVNRSDNEIKLFVKDGHRVSVWTFYCDKNDLVEDVSISGFGI